MCFGPELLYRLLIFLCFVILCVVLSKIWLLPKFGADARVTKTISIILWFLGACFVIYLLFMLFQCFVAFPLYPRVR